MKKRFLQIILIVSCFLIAVPAYSLLRTYNGIIFNPAIDGGNYLSVQGAQTLPQWDYNFGLLLDYGREPMGYDYYDANNVYQGRWGVVDDLIVANTYFSFGFTDWFTAGVNVPFVLLNRFYDPNQKLTAKEEKIYGLGDVRVEAKFRLLDMARYGVGVAIVPFSQLPTGRSKYYQGFGQFNGGGKLVVEAKIADRFYIAANAGYQVLKYVNWDINTPHAELNDLFLFGVGAALRLSDAWWIIGEGYGQTVFEDFFKYEIQTPIELLAGVRFSPQIFAKGFSLTLAGGKGINRGMGTANFRAMAGVSYHRSKVVTLPPPPPPVELEAKVEEKIIITQKIHFAFDKWNIRPVSYPILDDVVKLLKQNPQILKVRIEGHTDWIGSDAYNQRLSEKRAMSVKNYLVQHGISPSRLVTVGYGESRPVADNRTDKGRARNRRTEFTVLEIAPTQPAYTPVTTP